MWNFPKYLILVLACLWMCVSGYRVTGQNNTAPQAQTLPVELRPPHPPEKTEQRFTIDAKRRSEDVQGEDALPRSREFKRIDSTYYVGWMFEGVYKYNHASDYLGFHNAIVPLERALNLLEKDYAKPLGLRTDNIIAYFPTHFFKVDYTLIAYYLMNCYSNTDQPDKVFSLLRRAQKWKLQHHYYMDCYNQMAWTVHRNRFYTSAKYGFLKNSIGENEKLANRYLDSSLMMIERNRGLNRNVLPEMEESEKLSVYHVKNILYIYSFRIDSAMYYFNLMRNVNRLPHNNYANFKVVCGDFRTADNEYKIASNSDQGDKRLQEWAYYSSILDIYKARPKAGEALARNMIRNNGSTPGFGWYNIALARCLTYDGQIEESKKHLEKAADFKELHIGTTLGQSHYDFSVQLLKLINTGQEIALIKFQNKRWYLDPEVLLRIGQLTAEKYLQQFLIINQFAQNPERDMVIYKLFSTESTVSWDEIWYLIHDFSTHFFVDKFTHETQTNKRKIVNKYFNLFIARLKIQQGHYDEAWRILETARNDQNSDPDYERLYYARLFQSEAECAQKLNKTTEYQTWLYRLYLQYPQLVPFSGLTMNMRLHLSGDADHSVEKSLNQCQINWVTNSDIPAVQAYINIETKGAKREISYYVLDLSGNYIVKKQGCTLKKGDEPGPIIAPRLFDIGGLVPESEGD